MIHACMYVLLFVMKHSAALTSTSSPFRRTSSNWPFRSSAGCVASITFETGTDLVNFGTPLGQFEQNGVRIVLEMRIV